MTTLTTVSSALILQELDFSAWTLGSGYSRSNTPGFGAFGKTGVLDLPIITANQRGIREGQLCAFVGEDWSMLCDGGDGTNGWKEFDYTSPDRGFTWNSPTAQSIGYDNGSGGSWPAVATGWRDKYSGVYYISRVISSIIFTSGLNKGLPMGQYTGDLWHCSTQFGTYTLDQSYGPSGWASTNLLPGSRNRIGGTFITINEGSGAGNFEVGYQTQTVAGGTLTLGSASLFGPSIFPGSRAPENGKMFVYAEPGFPGYAMLLNLIAPAGTFTDSNAVMLNNDPLVGWSGVAPDIIQRIADPDTCNNRAVGVITHVTTDEGAAVVDHGYVPCIFDSYAQQESPGWHLQRSLCGVILEPYLWRLKYSDLGSTPHAASAPLTHTDIIAQYIVRVDASSAGTSYIAFRFRSDGTNGYELRLRATAGSNWLGLYKMDGTLIDAGTVTTAGVDANIDMHVDLYCVGTTIIAKLGGETQISRSDTSYANGTQIGTNCVNIVAEMKLLSAFNDDTITVINLPATETINFRSFGALPLAQSNTDIGGTALYQGPHYPISRIERNAALGVDLTTSSGVMWPGVYSASTPPPITGATRCFF